MILEKSQTTQQVIEQISAGAGKVGFINDTVLSEALLQLEQQGIPTNRHEDYKYFNADAIIRKDFKSIGQRFREPGDLSAYKLEDTLTLVVVNGNYNEALSDKVVVKGLHISSFSNVDDKHKARIGTSADVKGDAFVALNTAFSGNGLYVKVEKNADLRIPIHILYVSSADSEALVNPRNLIELEEGARATVIEQQVVVGNSRVFTNFLSEKFVERNASLISYTWQNEGPNGFSVNTNQVSVAADGHYDNTTLTLSGQAVRNNHNVTLNGQNGQAHLNGLFVGVGAALIDNHTLMDHRVPHCESNELYKGIVKDKSTGVFNGKIFVRKDAQKTNAYQSSKNILLSDDATINAKPQLEIYANDVKCSHGTSTGKIDENAMFYLNARGIGRESARSMLLSSFAVEVIDKIGVPALKDKIVSIFEKTL